jgi:hypothetical protein
VRRVARQQIVFHGFGAEAPRLDRHRLGDERRRHALALPRRSADRPPTHILIGRNGDYLRGRLLGVGADSLRLEMWFEEHEIATADVIAAIRLEPPVLPAAAPEPTGSRGARAGDAAEAGQEDGDELVQVVLSDRLRFAARLERWDAAGIVAQSRRLGRVELAIDEIEALVLGEGLRARADPRFSGWRLEVLPDPAVPGPTGE